MRWKRFIRKSHRYLSIFIGIQLLFWTVSGVYFSFIPIQTVRGEDHANPQEPPALELGPQLLNPSLLVPPDMENIRQIRLFQGASGPVFAFFGKSTRFPDVLVNAHTGQTLPPISPEQALRAAARDYGDGAEPRQAQLIQHAPNEYRGPLPVFRVDMDDARATRLYIHPVTGEVVSRRNRYWRLFDFLWMLHILDFKDREDINNNLLRALSVGGLAVVLSGYALWATSRKRRPKKR